MEAIAGCWKSPPTSESRCLVHLVYLVHLVDRPDEPNKPDQPDEPDRPDLFEWIDDPATSGLEPVSKLHDVHVHAETGRSVQAGIGEVLDPKTGIGMLEWTHANS